MLPRYSCLIHRLTASVGVRYPSIASSSSSGSESHNSALRDKDLIPVVLVPGRGDLLVCPSGGVPLPTIPVCNTTHIDDSPPKGALRGVVDTCTAPNAVRCKCVACVRLIRMPRKTMRFVYGIMRFLL
jgi:hypothetical protein